MAGAVAMATIYICPSSPAAELRPAAMLDDTSVAHDRAADAQGSCLSPSLWPKYPIYIYILYDCHYLPEADAAASSTLLLFPQAKV